MKKTVLLLILIVFKQLIYAQITSSYKNEVGIDVSGLILKYFKLVPEENKYQEFYYLTYRRTFKNFKIRAALGGQIAQNQTPSLFEGDLNTYQQTNKILYTRIGIEKAKEISAKWQVFYGLDFKFNSINNKDDALFWNSGYANGHEEKIINYGLGPLLGFRFRINKQLSISTETSFSYFIEKQNHRYYYTPVTSEFPSLEPIIQPTLNNRYGSFLAPLVLYFSYEF